MSEKSSHDRRDPAPIGGDLVIPVAAVVFTLYYGWTIIDSPWTAQVGAVFVGVILIALCLILFTIVGVRVRRGAATLRVIGTPPIHRVPKPPRPAHELARGGALAV